MLFLVGVGLLDYAGETPLDQCRQNEGVYSGHTGKQSDFVIENDFCLCHDLGEESEYYYCYYSDCCLFYKFIVFVF